MDLNDLAAVAMDQQQKTTAAFQELTIAAQNVEVENASLTASNAVLTQQVADLQQQIIDLTPKPPVLPDPGVATVTFDPSTDSKTEWVVDVADKTKDSVTLNALSADFKTGGYTSTNGHTPYARLNFDLIKKFGKAVRGRFSLLVKVVLPLETITNPLYLRFGNTDNYQVKDANGKRLYGALSADELRIGFVMYKDGCIRLMSAHENHEELELYKHDKPLTSGPHSFDLQDFVPAQDNTGSFKLTIDGGEPVIKTGVQTIPSTVASEEIEWTRIRIGTDGASAWKTKVARAAVTVALFIGHL